jgi:adenosylcobinamide-phosphate synthase
VTAELAAHLTPSLAVLWMALALDLLFGEPPNRLHPVAWMGRAMAAVTPARSARWPARRELVVGALIALALPSGFALGAAALLSAFAHLPALVELAASAVLLKTTFALRALGSAALRVQGDLARGELAQARTDLQSLCSRNPSQLDERQVVAATVESVAENASDSFVAPLLYYAALGLPGAVFYRAVNTLDAMIGYRGRYEYLGKAGARLDDLLNLLPARLTAALLLAAGPLSRADAARGLRILRRDRNNTESPNAGWPMAAMAGLLGVQLDKPGHYRLGDPGRAVEAGSIAAALRIVAIGAALAGALCALAIGARHAWLG